MVSLCYSYCMKFLGIDYGSKRVGLALSDDSGTMAFPHSVLKNDDSFLSTLCKLIESEGVREVVIGESHDTDGRPNEIQSAINELVGDLTLQVGIPVHLQPEQFTTQEAVRFQGRTDKTDASAAAIILNSYLTKKK